MRLRAGVALLTALTGVFCASSQEIQHPHKVTTFGDKAAADSLDIYHILHENAPMDLPVSGVPSVAVVGKGGNFVLGAGGFVKGVAGWDIGHPIPNPDEFITSQIPVGYMDGNTSKFNLSARQTHLFVNFVMLPASPNQIGAFIGVNFLDDEYRPVVQYAYLKYRGFKAGYDDTVFSDPACGAPTIDYEGPCSNTASPVGGISYNWRRGHWLLSAGIELPQTSFTTVSGKTKYVYQRVPDIPVAAQFSWGGGDSWVRLSAILRTLTFRDEELHKNHSVAGYGLQVSGAEYFLDRFTFFWQGVWGKGIGSMVQDTTDEGLDLTPSEGGASLSPVMLWGGFLSLRYDICSKFCVSATYSQLRTYAKKFEGGTTPRADLYKYGQYLSTTLFYDVTTYFEVGVEHIWGRRTNYDGARGADNRIQASFQLTF